MAVFGWLFQTNIAKNGRVYAHKKRAGLNAGKGVLLGGINSQCDDGVRRAKKSRDNIRLNQTEGG